MTTPDSTPPSSPAEPPVRFTARGPEDLIAFVPVALGFVPEESVTMLTFGGPRPFHARVDLPDDAEDVDLVVDTLLAPAVRHRVERVAFVLHADDTGVADGLAWALAGGFTGAGIDVIDALRVHAGHWFAMLPGRPPDHYAGVPFDPGSHPFAAQAVVAGRVTRGSREELRASLAPDPDRVGGVATALSGCNQSPVGPGLVAELVLRHVNAGTTCDDAETALLVTALARPALRDEAWAVLDRAGAVAHVDFWSDVVRRTPERWLAAPAAVLAVAGWLAGDGALSWCAVDRCREVDPDHTLAGLMADVLASATPPTVWDEVRPRLGVALSTRPEDGAA